MRIEIRNRLRPFSSTAGLFCLIPYTNWQAQIFPNRVFFRDLSSNEQREEKLPIKGPISKWLVMMDMERGSITISGKDCQGYFQHNLEKLFPFLRSHSLPLSKKRLFLGVSKKQDWDLVLKRCDMAEIFPFWLRLCDLIPYASLSGEQIGTEALVEQDSLEILFRTAFRGILCPSFQDHHYLGAIEDVNVKTQASPLGILHEGGRLIESLFWLQEGSTWHILPKLWPMFHAGRFIQLQSQEGDLIDLEWSKKKIKKMIIRPASSKEVTLRLQRGIHQFRVRNNPKSRGDVSGKLLKLEKGKILYLDRFN